MIKKITNTLYDNPTKNDERYITFIILGLVIIAIQELSKVL